MSPIHDATAAEYGATVVSWPRAGPGMNDSASSAAGAALQSAAQGEGDVLGKAGILMRQ